MVDPQPIEIRDHNGTRDWSWQSVQERYKALCAELGITPRIPEPSRHSEGNVLSIYPILYEVIEGIGSGDAACTQLGIEFIEQDQSFPFGYLLKYQTARALRRTALTDVQKQRIRQRVCSLLLEGRFPREVREYVRLLKVVGFEEYREQLVARLSTGDHPTYERYRLRLGL